MTDSETPPSKPSDAKAESKTPTQADLIEIHSLYARADAMAEAAEKAGKSDGEAQPAAAPPPQSAEQGDEWNDAG
ncbi:MULTISPECIES: hypothetical protein [Sulfitobacter]|uniref:hypothetical protein n=1 Tax=Sulfitobacter TaxID=60136 RepID=UPI0023073356|nr:MULTISPECIES: hypothetical protein [Sulfitobacter]MDF3382213.1 hypothetical protein [Sulfitobacter sp. Ks11]MDF3385632.1 hypothetical protein [Sulfitobacter sp. M85]MDF3389051.1 hypothetical protein [Sulfitobacter sp. Ks16]MDF3399688.1 hypothetical protein [Sulfitobacter sp. KE39]MDF3403109.1 hypothetical protein [Sulfitobacter sp. Ks35]